MIMGAERLIYLIVILPLAGRPRRCISATVCNEDFGFSEFHTGYRGENGADCRLLARRMEPHLILLKLRVVKEGIRDCTQSLRKVCS